MKISETSRESQLYIYSDEIEFRKNDLVLWKDSLYTVIADKVYGNPEEKPSSYKLYLGDKLTSVEEYINFSEKQQGEDKYISTNNLQAILNHFLVGVDSKGIIGIIDENDDSDNKTVLDNPSISVDYKKIIWEIWRNEKINHAIYAVSRNLPELAPYIKDSGENPCLLKQYTYYNGETRIRIQELIDPDAGLIFYRADNNYTYTNSFKCAIVDSMKVKTRLDNLLALYSARLNYLSELEENLRNNFRNRRLAIESSVTSITLGKTKGSENYIGDTDHLTLLITKIDNERTVQTWSITINLMEKIDELFPIYSVFNDGCLINLEEVSGGLQVSLQPNNSSTYKISSISYREYYGQ